MDKLTANNLTNESVAKRLDIGTTITDTSCLQAGITEHGVVKDSPRHASHKIILTLLQRA